MLLQGTFLNTKNNRLLVIDTGFNDHYLYKNFLTLAKSVGFDAEVKNFFQTNVKDLGCYECVIVNLDDAVAQDYLKNRDRIDQANPLTQQILLMLRDASTIKKQLLGLMLPSKMGATAKDVCQNIFDLKLSILETTNAVKRSLCEFLLELLQSDSKRSISYHTTLLTKREKDSHTIESTAKIKIPNCIDERTNSLIVGHLPFHTSHLLPPLAWYYTNPIGENHLFITKASLLLFSDIAENFIYNPLDFSLRTERLHELQQLLSELNKVCVLGKFSKAKMTLPQLPSEFSKSSLLKQRKKFRNVRSSKVDKKLYDWIERDGIWCGWGSLETYKDEQAVKSLIKSNLNLIWFEMNPEWYLALNALKKNEAENFLQTIGKVTENFKKNSNIGPLPHIFVGTDLTSNFATAPVENPCIDCFGKVYTKIPSPLDFNNFWKPELLDVFDTLVNKWSVVGNGIPISGIFLDLEMYHAQNQAGHYLSTMDFSDLAWQIFCKNTGQTYCYQLKTTQERVSYLLKNNLFEWYFGALQKRAYEIGLAIKNHINRKLPNALIGVYDIHLPHSWFYKGFLAGLSSPSRPLLLATFNNDFYCHWPWLIKNKIYAYHLPVLLLSKFQTIQDFDLIRSVAGFHDGAWFNRFSRLEESRDPKDWKWDYAVEVTPLETPFFVNQLHSAISKIQSTLRK